MRLLILFVIVFSCVNLTVSTLFDKVIASKTKLKKLKRSGEPTIVPVPDIIKGHGYPVESYTVVTSDGYTLLIHRIPHSSTYSNSTVRRQPVLLTHGFFVNSAIWVVSGPGKGLAYILSDAGYDVWLINLRGTTQNKPSSDATFWNFSFQEIGEHDLPSTIDHIYRTKARESPEHANVADLLYVGHSMGCTSLFVALTSKVEYNKKIKAAFALAPVVYMDGVTFPLETVSPFAKLVQRVLKVAGTYNISPTTTVNDFMKTCTVATPRRLCENVVLKSSGYDRKNFEKTIYPDLYNCLAPISVKTAVHFSQFINGQTEFQKFDYGPVKNLFEYGQLSAPKLDLLKITTPIALFYGLQDVYATPSDVKRVYETIQDTAIGLYKIDFTHNQFTGGSRAPELVYKRVVKLMNNYR